MNKNYFLLLQDIGINLDPNEIAPSESDSEDGQIKMPSKPLYYREGGLPVFSDAQLEWFEPELAGFMNYDVVEDTSLNLGFLNFEDEKFLQKKRIHFYNRKDRFMDLVQRWFNFRIKVPNDVIEMVRLALVSPETTLRTQRAYNTVRIVLKRAGMAKYYGDIPRIIFALGGPKLKASDAQIQGIKNEFISLSIKFNRNKQGRKRFPLYQHLLVDLMEQWSIDIPYHLPKARTKIRRQGINLLLEKINLEKL